MSQAGWRVLDFTAFAGDIVYERGRLVVYDADFEKQAEVPLVQIAVILIGGQTRISGGLMAKLSAEDVAVLVCDWRHVPVAGAYPWSGHTRIGARHRAQAAATIPKLKNAWGRIVSAKIAGQAKTLKLLSNSSSDKLLKLSKTVRSGDPENKEALAARIYWSALGDDEFFRRSPGINEGGLNSCLDYAYTVLRGHGIRAICAAGLCGALGVFHRGRSNQYALVDDLMEPFRPVIDAFVLTRLDNFDTGDSEVKQQLVLATNLAFDRSGKTIPSVFTEFAQNYGLYIEGDRKLLEVPCWNGVLADAEVGL